MNDPIRIPLVLAELKEAWEGQPDLTLSTMFGILQNRGIGWGTDDDQLLIALKELKTQHPADISGPRHQVVARYLIETSKHRVTIDPYQVIVRTESFPGVWEYDTLRCRVGFELVIGDTEGFQHHLGKVSRITLLSDSPRPGVDSLSGMQRSELESRVFLLSCESGETIVLGAKATIYVAERREVHSLTSTWKALIQVEVGKALHIERPGGQAPLRLGNVAKILVVEA